MFGVYFVVDLSMNIILYHASGTMKHRLTFVPGTYYYKVPLRDVGGMKSGGYRKLTRETQQVKPLHLCFE